MVYELQEMVEHAGSVVRRYLPLLGKPELVAGIFFRSLNGKSDLPSRMLMDGLHQALITCALQQKVFPQLEQAASSLCISESLPRLGAGCYLQKGVYRLSDPAPVLNENHAKDCIKYSRRLIPGGQIAGEASFPLERKVLLYRAGGEKEKITLQDLPETSSLEEFNSIVRELLFREIASLFP